MGTHEHSAPASAARAAVLVLAAGAFAACHHIEATHNLCGGTTACPKDACAPVDVISGRPNRPYRPLGIVQVRVDRGTGLQNPTLRDAIPALENEARSMGADAVILTFEEFSNWYDKGEEASPIHDLERQESWYITEKARYLSGLAVVYTGPCEPCRAGMGMGVTMPGPAFTPTFTPTFTPAQPSRPAPVPAPAPSTLPPPSSTPNPTPAPSLPPGEIDLPRAGDAPPPAPAPAPTEAPAEAPPPAPAPAPSDAPPAPEPQKPPTPAASLPPPRHIPAPVQTSAR